MMFKATTEHPVARLVAAALRLLAYPLRRYRCAPLRLLGAAAVATMLGCAGAPTPTNEYLLRLPFEANGARRASSSEIAIGRVSIAPYLQRDGIVVEIEAQRIQAARDHRWAEPLPRSLRRALQEGIATATGREVVDAETQGPVADGTTVIDVQIHRLHGSLEGEVALAADWQLRGADGIVARHSFAETVLTRASGYDALVAAHVELLEALSSAIAQTVDPRQ